MIPLKVIGFVFVAAGAATGGVSTLEILLSENGFLVAAATSAAAAGETAGGVLTLEMVLKPIGFFATTAGTAGAAATGTVSTLVILLKVKISSGTAWGVSSS